MADWTQRPYQDFAVDWLVRNRRCILGDDKGLGKTLEIGRALIVVKPKRILLLVPGTAAMYVWKEDQLPKWGIEQQLGLTLTVIRGPQEKRKKLWSTEPFVVATYAGFRTDSAAGIVPAKWDVIICDEYHRAFKKRKTKTWSFLKQLLGTDNVRYFWPTSGSALVKGPQDLWATLNLCNPRIWSSYWKFINTYTIQDWNGFSQEIIGVKNQEQLKRNLEPIFLRRTKGEVLPELPPKTRQPVFVDMTSTQAHLYDQMAQDMIITLQGHDGMISPLIASTILEKTVNLRKILVSPQMVDPHCGDWGGAIEHLLDELSGAEVPAQRHCVIYTPFRDAVPLIRRAVENRLQWSPERSPIIELMGGKGSKAGAIRELKEKIDFYRANKGIAICTIQFAESFELDPADHCYFVGYEWDQEQNGQAEDRLHRGTIKWPVNCYYYRYHGTYDDEVMAILDRNVNATQFLMRNGAFLRKVLQQRRK